MIPTDVKYQKISKALEEMSIGELIQYKRTRVFDLSQDDFAERFGVSLGTLRNWEQGISTPPPYFLMLLDDEERLMSIRMATPIERKRQAENDNYVALRRKILRQYAVENLQKDDLFKEACDCVNDITRESGFAESMQNLYPFFEDTTVSDFAVFLQLALLQRIDKKLDQFVEKKDLGQS